MFKNTDDVNDSYHRNIITLRHSAASCEDMAGSNEIKPLFGVFGFCTPNTPNTSEHSDYQVFRFL